MRFKIKKKIIEQPILIGRKGPNIGDTKEKIKFAFFPVKIDHKNIVWLEKYKEIWTYEKKHVASYNPFLENFPDTYSLSEWIIVWRLKERKFIN